MPQDEPKPLEPCPDTPQGPIGPQYGPQPLKYGPVALCMDPFDPEWDLSRWRAGLTTREGFPLKYPDPLPPRSGYDATGGVRTFLERACSFGPEAYSTLNQLWDHFWKHSWDSGPVDRSQFGRILERLSRETASYSFRYKRTSHMYKCQGYWYGLCPREPDPPGPNMELIGAKIKHAWCPRESVRLYLAHYCDFRFKDASVTLDDLYADYLDTKLKPPPKDRAEFRLFARFGLRDLKKDVKCRKTANPTYVGIIIKKPRPDW